MSIQDFVPVVGDRVSYFHDDDLDPGAGTRFKNTWTSAKVVSVTDADNVGLEVGGVAVNGGLDVTRWNRAVPRSQLDAISDLVATAVVGGTLVDDTYFYVVTATGTVGESAASNEDSATTALIDNSVSLTWTAVSGVTGYRIYRSLTSGSGYELLDTSVTNSYTDNGGATPSAGTPPTRVGWIP